MFCFSTLSCFAITDQDPRKHAVQVEGIDAAETADSIMERPYKCPQHHYVEVNDDWLSWFFEDANAPCELRPYPYFAVWVLLELFSAVVVSGYFC